MKVFEAILLTVGAFIPLAAVLRFAELETLNHGAHGAVQHGDAMLQQAGQGLGTGVTGVLKICHVSLYK